MQICEQTKSQQTPKGILLIYQETSVSVSSLNTG